MSNNKSHSIQHTTLQLPSSTMKTTTTTIITTDLLSVPPTSAQMKRKLSFPVALHSTQFLSDSTAAFAARRRLSNVSDVVTRKLSHTIGWKTPAIPTQDLITQGKCLCGQYIRCRLRRSGVFNKKIGLQRLRSIVGTPSVHIVREVFPVLNFAGEELERMHPKLYINVARQISRASGGELNSPDSATILLSAVARELFRNDITWGKVVSLFAIAGGLAVDCVRQGHQNYLPKLIEGIADVIEDELVVWINENGGWTGLSTHIRPTTSDLLFHPLEWAALGIAGVFGIIILFFLFKFISLKLITILLNK